MKHVKLAFLGFGNVGKALARLLLAKQKELAQTYQLTFSATGIATSRHGTAIDPNGLDLDQANLLPGGPFADPDDPILNRRGMHQDLDDLILQVLFRPGQPGHPPHREGCPPRKIGESQIEEDQRPGRNPRQ